MKIQKLIRQYGEHGNEYSVLEIGDTVNEIIDLLERNIKLSVETVEVLEKTKIVDVKRKEEEKNDSKDKVEVVLVKEQEIKKQNFTPIKGDMTVRSPSSQDRVYLIRDSKKHWIRNPETLFKLGFTFHNVKNIPNEEMDTYETGDDLNLKEEELEVIKPKIDGFDKYNI